MVFALLTKGIVNLHKAIQRRNGMKTWTMLLCYPFLILLSVIAFMAIFFPPPPSANGLRFIEMEQEAPLLSFNPNVSIDKLPEIETGLKRNSIQIIAKVTNNGSDLDKVVDAIGRCENADPSKNRF